MALHRRRHPSTLGFDAFELAWETNPPGTVYLLLRIRRSVLFALAVAICLHVALLLWVLHRNSMPELPLTGSPSENISARLIAPEASRPRAEPQPAAAPPPEPPPRPAARPKRDTPRPPAKPRPDVLRAPDPDPAPAPPHAPAKPRLDDEPTDMMSFVNKQRERRRAAEAAESRESAAGAARERVPSADEIALANIKRNLQQPGTSGVFQITRKGVRTAAFVFRGWTTDAVNARREYIEVDAGLGGDIERALVRRMIELIRRYYQGNFNWESRVLGRTVVLSAAPENTTQLEDFLIREFFRSGASYPP
jgi:outer membrane biosynthesis protein TonB